MISQGNVHEGVARDQDVTNYVIRTGSTVHHKYPQYRVMEVQTTDRKFHPYSGRETIFFVIQE